MVFPDFKAVAIFYVNTLPFYDMFNFLLILTRNGEIFAGIKGVSLNGVCNIQTWQYRNRSRKQKDFMQRRMQNIKYKYGDYFTHFVKVIKLKLQQKFCTSQFYIKDYCDLQ